jgi:hypothetical protein
MVMTGLCACGAGTKVKSSEIGNDSQLVSNSKVSKDVKADDSAAMVRSIWFATVESADVVSVPESEQYTRHYTQRSKLWFITNDLNKYKLYDSKETLDSDINNGIIIPDSGGKIFVITITFTNGSKKYYAVSGDEKNVNDTLSKIPSDKVE